MKSIKNNKHKIYQKSKPMDNLKNALEHMNWYAGT